MNHQVRCLSCGYVSNSHDPFMDLSLELRPGCTNLRDCLVHYTAAETLEGKNAYRWGTLDRVLCLVHSGVFVFGRKCVLTPECVITGTNEVLHACQAHHYCKSHTHAVGCAVCCVLCCACHMNMNMRVSCCHASSLPPSL